MLTWLSVQDGGALGSSSARMAGCAGRPGQALLSVTTERCHVGLMTGLAPTQPSLLEWSPVPHHSRAQLLGASRSTPPRPP